MSQQPPYPGSDQPYQQPQQPYQQPNQQPYTPYSPAGYPNPYQAYPQRRDHTTRNVLLVVGAVVVLFCAGIAAFFVWAVNSVEDGLDYDYEGSSDAPLTVEEGEAFSIRGFDYEAGWKVTTGGRDGTVIAPVRATNNRSDDDTDSANLTFRLYRDNEQLATVTCLGGISVAPGRSVTLDCSSYGEDVTGFDEIEVYDTSVFE